MAQDALLVCGLLVAPSYVFLYVLGGALRPGYSHISNSVSGLLSPGAPNKITLGTIQVAYALLHVLFGLGVLGVVRGSPNGALSGYVGAWTIVALGAATIGTAVFPQDAEGTPATTPGRIHKVLVFAVLIPASILSTLLIGLWSKQVGFLSGFDVYSFATVGAIVVMGAIGSAAVKTRYAGLSERVAALVTHQWLLVLALRLLLQ
jgi:hypothetical protein